MKRLIPLLGIVSILSACAPGGPSSTIPPWKSFPVPSAEALAVQPFGASVKYAETPATLNPDIAKDFSVDEVQNLKNMEEAWGVTFSAADKSFLAKNKFLVKRLADTSIKPSLHRDVGREFLGLYNTVKGRDTAIGVSDYKERTQANSVFFTSDIFFHSYNILYTELLKEMENTVFFPAMKDLAKTFYEQSQKKVAASTGAEQEKWRKVRDYFAVAHALFQTAGTPLSQEALMQGNPETAQSSWAASDKKADTIETATAFVKALTLEPDSEERVLADLQAVYKSEGAKVPTLFKQEYDDYSTQTGIGFKTDFTQFTPRSHYTTSSLRRQYFRGMMWFSQVPLFLKSPALTTYAFSMAQLLAENPKQMQDYATLETMINFLVGESDDLMPTDYLTALAQVKNAQSVETAAVEALAKMRDPKIKSIPATYSAVGKEKTSDVLLLTKGMRFMSQKFVIDSYWTGQLTQGDEAPKPGYTQKLPPMASSLEVMALLGSDYAKTQIPKLDFYRPDTKEAIDKAMKDLGAETATLGDDFWTKNIYNGWLWTIRSLFAWQKANGASLPQFMQSEPWSVKTLQAASGFWTELRHATLLYAKQSFAELGGGPPPCDTRKVPPPPKGYIEPQIQAFDRLAFLAKRTKAGIEEQGFALKNLPRLDAYNKTLDLVRGLVAGELGNAVLHEKVVQVNGKDPYDETKECVQNEIEGQSDWETIRVAIVQGLADSLPEPVDGPILPTKDKRAALVADVHTGGDSRDPRRVLYEGTGVPNVIFVAVKDANGPRLTVGFTYSHYESVLPYGGKRMTDEQWQEKFYKPADDFSDPFQYTPIASWPALNFWYEPLFAK